MTNEHEISEEEFIELAANHHRRVQTPEGAKKYGQPIGTIITPDMIKALKKKEAKAKKPSSETLGTKFDPQTGKMKSGAKAKKLSPSENYGTVDGTTLKESSLHGPNQFKVGSATFNAPAGSKLIRPKNQQYMAYVLTADGTVHAFNGSGEVPIPDNLENILKNKFASLGKGDNLYTVEAFDSKKSLSLADQKPGATLSSDGQVAFTKTNETDWENTLLGVTLTDDDLQSAFDSGKFELKSANLGETDFSKMTKDEVVGLLDSYPTGKQIVFDTHNGLPATLEKLDSGNWKNTKFDNVGISSEDLAKMTEGTDWISDKTEPSPDAPAIIQDPISTGKAGKTKDQRLTETATDSLATPESITGAVKGTVVFHKTKGMLTKSDNDEWNSADSSFTDLDVSASATYKSISNLPWNAAQQDAYDQYQADQIKNQGTPDSATREISIPSNAEQITSLDGFQEGDKIYVDLDGQGIAELTKNGDGTWDSHDGMEFSGADLSYDLEANAVWAEPKSSAVEATPNPYLETAKSLKTKDVMKSHDLVAPEIQTVDELKALEPGSIITIGNKANYLAYVKDDKNNFLAGDGNLFSFTADDLEADVNDTSYHVEQWTPKVETKAPEAPKTEPKKAPDTNSGGLSSADKKSALEALQSHSGFQVKYGLKSLPDNHPLKNENTLQAELDKAKKQFPDMAPKKALMTYLGGEEPLADWEKALLNDNEEQIQIGSVDAKDTQTGVTGGSFLKSDVEKAIQILENYNGKIFKAELNKNGNPLGKLSPNDIVGFNKDKTITKQKFIDLLKGKVDKSSSKKNVTPEASKTIDEAIQSDTQGLLDPSLSELDPKTITLDQVENAPIGSKAYYNGDPYEKTASNTWYTSMAGGINFPDQGMHQSFNNNNGWSFNEPDKSPDVTPEAPKVGDKVTYEQAQTLPVGASIMTVSGTKWVKTGDNEWRTLKDGEVSDVTFETVDTISFLKAGNGTLHSLNDTLPEQTNFENGHALITDPSAKKIGGQAGSNEGGLYTLNTPDGPKDFYVKKPQSEDHGKNEALANDLYKELGVKAPNVDLSSDGNLYSEIVSGKHDMEYQMKSKFGQFWKEKVQKDFAIDAWLSNRDVFGLTYDNILTDSEGNPWRIDNGGALKYRAQGQAKTDFGPEVTELAVFKTGKKSAIFGPGTMDKKQELDGVHRLANLSPDMINSLVEKHGMDASTADTLKARREYILNHYGVADPFNPDAPKAEGLTTTVQSNELGTLLEGTKLGFKASPYQKKPNFYIEKTPNGWNAEGTAFSDAEMKIHADKGYLIMDENSTPQISIQDQPAVATPDVAEPANGIAPGKYNTGKGAKAHLYVNPDGTGYYIGMKGIVKELDAEGVKKNFDAGMNTFQGPDQYNGGASTASKVSPDKNSIPNLGSIDSLPDGTYDGPMGVKYTIKGDEVVASKEIKSMEFSDLKVGQIPNEQFFINAPAGTQLAFKYNKYSTPEIITKQEDGEWTGSNYALNYIGAISSSYAYNHTKWKIRAFPGSDDKTISKSTLKTKYLQGQILNPETKTSVIPDGYSGAVTFYGGPADIASLSAWRDLLADPDLETWEKNNAHSQAGASPDIQFMRDHLLKKNNLESWDTNSQMVDAIVAELNSYLSKASVPAAKDFSSIFQYDENGAVSMPIEVVGKPKPSYYDSTKTWTEYIKNISDQFGDGKVIGVNMAGASKDNKENWVSYFQQGNFAAMYNVELQTAKTKGKAHPTGTDHPGHPNNKETNKISWGAAVKGEVPAGIDVPGNWTSTNLEASLSELDNYLIAAKMQNPTHLSTYEKRQWVTGHREGYKQNVDELSAKAALRAKNNETPLSEAPVWSDNIVPAKSYDSMFDSTQFPQNWSDYYNHSKASDFFEDHHAQEPELDSLYAQVSAEKPYGYADEMKAEVLNKFFASKEEAYLEELNKPIWEVKKIISEGSHPTFIVKDQKSEKMKIFKPTTTGKEWRADNEVAAHNLGAMLGFNVPGAVIGDVNEGIPMGTNNNGIVMNFAPNVGSLGNVDGSPVDLKTLTPTQFGQIAKEHVFDWFLDNDDTHDENLLIGTNGDMVAIDKGRAFFNYGHWHGLDVDNPSSLNINTKDSPTGRKSVVYYDMIQAIKSGQISQAQLDEAYKQAIKAAKRVQKSDNNTIEAFVRSASDKRTSWDIPHYAQDWKFLTPNPSNQDELVQAVLARKNSMLEDFETFYDKLYKASGFSKPLPPAKALGEDHLSGWEESDVLVKTEESKVWGAAPIHASAGFKDGASLLWTEKDTEGNSVISGKMQLGNLTQQKVMDFMASKLNPNSGVQATASLQDYPTAHVKQWKKTVTAVGKDLSANATSGSYNQQLWDTMKETEAKVDTDLAYAQTVDTAQAGVSTFPSGITLPNETVPQYVMALNYHKKLVAQVESAKAANEPTDKNQFQDFTPPFWKVKGKKYISPEGASYKELDNGNYVEVKAGVASVVPDVPEAAKSGAPGWTVEAPDGAVDQSAEKYSLISAGMFAGQLNADGEKILKPDFSTSGHPGKEYRIDLPTGEKIFFRDGSQTSTVRSQTGTVRFQLNRLLDNEASLSNVQKYLETAGVDTTGADEEQVENIYWRQMFSRVILTNTNDASKEVKAAKSKLQGMKNDLAQQLNVGSISDFDIVEAIGLTNKNEHSFWNDLAKETFGASVVDKFLADGEHLPRYQHMDLNDPSKSTGLPWYKRIDVQLDELRKNGTMIAHGNNGKDARHFDYIKSGALTSTEERLRILGYYKEGASSSSDQGHGSANFVFTRIAVGSAAKKGALYGSHVMYWSPDVMAMTGTYSFDSDQFGELNNQSTGTPFNPMNALTGFTGGGNETMVPNNISLLDFMEVMVFDTETERLKAIEEFKKKGIETLRGHSIEDRLVLRTKLDSALAKIKAAWKN